MIAATRMPTAAEVFAALVERDPALPDLALVLDPARHEELLGFPSKVERMRYKPGASAVAAVRGEDGSRHWLHSNAAPEKLDKGRQRAARAGETVRWVTPRTQAGTAWGDRQLAPLVARLRRRDAGVLAAAEIVRYNPHRRLVLRSTVAGSVCALKLAARPPGRGDGAARSLATMGVPVLAPVDAGDGITVTEWWGRDLAAAAAPQLERAAGAALARLHRVPASALPALQPYGAAAAAGESARAVATLLPELAVRAHALAGAIAGALDGERPLVVVHGDWSLDQVLSDGDGIRCIDFDRVALAPPERDLGSALASDGSTVMLEGYLDAGGTVDDAALAAWTALAGLERAIEPFRSGEHDWPAQVERRLHRAEGALA